MCFKGESNVKLSLMRHEFNLMMTSKKNILFIIFLLIGMGSYIFFILPNEETVETFDSEQTHLELESLYHTQAAREDRRGTGVMSMTGRSHFADNEYQYNLRKGLYHAFENSEFNRFTYLRTHHLHSIRQGLVADNDIFPEDSPSPVKDGTHYMDKQLLIYENLLNLDIPITYSMIEEKTSLQVLKNGLLTILPFLIFFSAIYFSNDVLVRDRKQTSTLQGLPVSWYQIINTKTVAAFLYTLLITFGLLVVGVILLGIINGFGSFEMIVPTFEGQVEVTAYGYDTISLLKFFMLSFSFIPLLIFMFIRLNMMISLLFRNEWVVLVLAGLALVSERFYYTREKRELFGLEIDNFPQTYFDVGKIVTGEKNFLVNLESITYVKGMTVLLITFVAIEIAVFLFTRIINRRRFYNI